MARFKKMSTPYGMGETSALGELFFVLNSPGGGGGGRFGGRHSEPKKEVFDFPAVFASSIAVLAYGISDV